MSKSNITEIIVGATIAICFISMATCNAVVYYPVDTCETKKIECREYEVDEQKEFE